MKKRLGIIGFGKIGQYIFEKLKNDADIIFIYDKNYPADSQAAQIYINDLKQLVDKSKETDLIVECAVPDVLKTVGSKLLENSNIMPFSLTAFADSEFAAHVKTILKTSGTKLYIPHGAILGLDGIFGARSILNNVEIVTIKKPASLGLSNTKREVVYKGNTREACFQFPRNVNVHAAVALCGLGMENTQSVLISDPDVTTNKHIISIEAKGCNFKLEISSDSGSGVTGAYTPVSAVESIKRVLLNEAISIV